jgi:predicted nuclease with RNAse H fold
MIETTIVGIDCATDDARVGLSLAVVRADQCVVRSAGACFSERKVAQQVASWLSNSTRGLIALDAPLGWPHKLGKELAGHRAGVPLTVSPNELFRRSTDHFVKERLGKQSLDVGADRIARTAHAALQLLGEVRQVTGLPIPLAWQKDYPDRVAAIEVYPAASLTAHGIAGKGYKKKEKIEERKAILDNLARLIQLPTNISAMEESADALDAAVCVLAGLDFLRGEVYDPDDLETAKKEGWIWVGPRHRGDTSTCPFD